MPPAPHTSAPRNTPAARPAPRRDRWAAIPRCAAAVVALAALVVGGCAGAAPRIDDPAIARKMDLRLRTALEGAGWSEDLGDYIRLIVRMEREERAEDREALDAIGHIGSWNGHILTFTVAPDRVVDLASYSQVAFIELSMPNVPAPPPGLHPEG